MAQVGTRTCVSVESLFDVGTTATQVRVCRVGFYPTFFLATIRGGVEPALRSCPLAAIPVFQQRKRRAICRHDVARTDVAEEGDRAAPDRVARRRCVLADATDVGPPVERGVRHCVSARRRAGRV